ncbi:MAG: MEDS domain-containing protein [Candidatus Auribacterota bacterium]|nr:MEDS domain-containing protein [Candidatus Auribacterota bacterium]
MGEIKSNRRKKRIELNKQNNIPEERPIRFTDGTHIVGIYTREDNILNAVIPFFVEGMEEGDRCFYAASPETIIRVKKALGKEKIMKLAENRFLSMRIWFSQ